MSFFGVHWRVRILPLCRKTWIVKVIRLLLLLKWMLQREREKAIVWQHQTGIFFSHILDESFLQYKCACARWSSSIRCTLHSTCTSVPVPFVHTIVSSHNLDFCFMRSIRMKNAYYFVFWVTHTPLYSYQTKESDFTAKKRLRSLPFSDKLLLDICE